MIAVNRQLRIDEDIQGWSDEQLTGLLTLGEIMLRTKRLDAAERTLLYRRIAMFRAELMRRAAE